MPLMSLLISLEMDISLHKCISIPTSVSCVYIHVRFPYFKFYSSGTCIETSSGVFTIGMLPSPFTKDYELDLIVVNLSNNVAKCGRPTKGNEKPTEVDLSSISEQWINISMEKSGTSCKVTITNDATGSTLVNGGDNPCDLESTGHIVIASRARDPDSATTSGSDSSFVSIRSVKWHQQ